MDSIILYLKESYNELVNKVTWPSWNSLLVNTRLVIVASLIIALFIFVMDFISRQVVELVYSL